MIAMTKPCKACETTSHPTWTPCPQLEAIGKAYREGATIRSLAAEFFEEPMTYAYARQRVIWSGEPLRRRGRRRAGAR